MVVSCGGFHSLILDNDGIVWILGMIHFYGVSLEKENKNGAKFYKISVQNIKSISCGYDFSVCCDSNGDVWSFGNNNCGHLGLGDL